MTEKQQSHFYSSSLPENTSTISFEKQRLETAEIKGCDPELQYILPEHIVEKNSTLKKFHWQVKESKGKQGNQN